MDRLLRLRAPLAVVVLATYALSVLTGIGLGLTALARTGAGGGLAVARFAPSGAAPLVLLGVLISSCFVGPEVVRRRTLAACGAAAAAFAALSTLMAVVLAVVSHAGIGWNPASSLAELVTTVVVAVALVALARRDVVRDLVPQPAVTPEGEAEVVPVPDPELEPSWSQDTAAGAVWRTAGEAASGAPALGWGTAAGTEWRLPPEQPSLGSGPDQARPDAGG